MKKMDLKCFTEKKKTKFIFKPFLKVNNFFFKNQSKGHRKSMETNIIKIFFI